MTLLIEVNDKTVAMSIVMIKAEQTERGTEISLEHLPMDRQQVYQSALDAKTLEVEKLQNVQKMKEEQDETD